MIYDSALRVQPIPRRLLIAWATPPAITAIERTVTLPPNQTGAPRLSCRAHDEAASICLQVIERAARERTLVVRLSTNVLTRRPALIVADARPWQPRPTPLAELLVTVDEGEPLTLEVREMAPRFLDLAARRGLALVIHSPREGTRDGAMAYAAEYEFRPNTTQHYLARLFVDGSDAAQWEEPSA